MSPPNILHRLAKADRAWQKTASMEGLLRSVKYICGAAILLIGLDILLHLGDRVRFTLSIVAGLSFVAWIALSYYRAFVKKAPLLRIARLLEERDPSLGSKLINTLQLADKASDANAAELTRKLAQRAVDEAARDLESKKFLPLTKSPTLKRTASRAAAVLAAVAIPALLFATIAGREILRFLDPFGDHPPFSLTTLTIVSPNTDDVEVIYKKSLNVEVAYAGHRPDELFLELSDPAKPDAPSSTVPMFPSGENRFVQQLDDITTDLLIRAKTKGGWSISEARRVKVLLTPQIEKSVITVIPPSYTHLPSRESVVDLGGKATPTINALKGSELKFQITSNRPLSAGYIETQGADKPVTPIDLTPGTGEHANSITGNRKVEESGRMKFIVKDVTGLTTTSELFANLTVTHDLPPDIAITEPVQDGFIVENFSTKVAIKSSDDYGLKTIRLHKGLNGTYGEPRSLELQEDPPIRDSTEGVEVTPKEMGAKPGDMITVFGETIDNCPTPHLTRSNTLSLEVISEKDYLEYVRMQTEIADLEEKYGQFQDEMKRLAEEQRALAKEAAEAKNSSQKDQAALSQRQQELNAKLEKLAQTMEQATSENPLYDLERDLQKVLNKEAAAIRDSVAKNKEQLEKFQSGQPSSEGNQQFSKAGEEQADRLDPAAKEAEKAIADALEDSQKMQELLKSMSAFEQLYEQQQKLAEQTKAYRTKKEMSNEDRLALQNMAGNEREIGELLQQIVEKLRADAKDAAETYPEAAQDAEDIADAIEKANLTPMAETSAKSMLAGRGAESSLRAEQLRAEMEKLMGECQSCKGGGEGEFAQRLKLMRSMMAGNTFSQMAQCKKFGMGKGNGQAMGGGGTGMGGKMATGTMPGNQPKSLLGGQSALGRRTSKDSINSSNGIAQGKAAPPGTANSDPSAGNRTGIQQALTNSTSLQGDAALEEYRDVVDAYFRRITTKSDRKP